MMDLTWYLLGVVTGGTVLFLRHLSVSVNLNWTTWCGLLVGIATLLFCGAWTVGAYLEGVPRAAAMGLLVFGLGGVVTLSITARVIMKHPKSPERGDE